MLISLFLASVLPLLADGPPPVPQAVAALEQLKPKANNGPLAWTAGPYVYDGAGNVITTGPEAFVYDKIGRLGSATVRGPDLNTLQTQTYRYDDYGNLIRTEKLGQTVDLCVTPSTNRLKAASHDAAGNVTGWGAYHYEYDAVGMMNSVRVGPSRVIYAYTADDERLFSFDVSSNTTHWTLRGFDNRVLRDFRQSGSTWSVERDYVYRDGLLLAALRPAAAVEHYSLDHLGSPRLITDGGGHKIGYHVYWPFGEEWSPGNAQEGAPLQFIGHERDADPAGGANPLDYLHARYYRAEWGRFLAVDKAAPNVEEPQSWNRYVYGGNSPITHLDLNGRDKIAAFVMGLAGGPAAAERYRNVSTMDAIFGRDAAHQMQKAYIDTPLVFKVEAEITLGVLSLTKGPVAAIAGKILGGARSAAVDKWMDLNAERMNDKLGRKLGEGRLPFDRSPEGAKQAREAIRSTLNDPDAVRSGQFTTRGGNATTDIYSPKTGMTVRIREDGSFDTLIDGQTDRFEGRTPSAPPTP